MRKYLIIILLFSLFSPVEGAADSAYCSVNGNDTVDCSVKELSNGSIQIGFQNITPVQATTKVPADCYVKESSVVCQDLDRSSALVKITDTTNTSYDASFILAEDNDSDDEQNRTRLDLVPRSAYLLLCGFPLALIYVLYRGVRYDASELQSTGAWSVIVAHVFLAVAWLMSYLSFVGTMTTAVIAGIVSYAQFTHAMENDDRWSVILSSLVVLQWILLVCLAFYLLALMISWTTI